MEEPKKNKCKEDRKKMAIKVCGGGGIGGAVLLGGALATATLVSVFTIRRRRRIRKNSSDDTNHQHPPPNNPPNELKVKDDNNKSEASKGLCFLLPDSSPPINHQSSNGTADHMGVTKIDSTSLISTQILILDEKPKLEFKAEKVDPAYGDDEILLSDIPRKKESNPMFDESVISTELSLPVSDSSLLLKPENVKKNELFYEFQVMKENEAPEAAHGDQIAVEDNPQRPLNTEEEEEEEEEEEGNDDGQVKLEKIEDVAEVAHGAIQMQLDEEQEIPTIVDQEIIFADSSIEIHAVKKQEISLPLFDSSSISESENVNSNESLSIEAVQVMKGDNTINAAHGDEIGIEENPQLQLTEEQIAEDSNDDDGEIIVEKSEEAVETAHAYQSQVEDDQQIIQLSEVQETNENDDQENLCSDSWIPESSPFNVQEFTFPVLEIPSLSKHENENVIYSKDTPMSIGAAIAMEEDQANEVARADDHTAGDNSTMLFTGKEQNECLDDVGRKEIVASGEEVIETIQADIAAVGDNPQTQSSEEEEEDVEESSEGTGDSSMESNAEAIWPAESMQDLSIGFTDLKINGQKLDKNFEDNTTEEREKDNRHSNMEDTGDHHDIKQDEAESLMNFSQKFMMEPMTWDNQPKNSSNLRIWIWSLWCLCHRYFGFPFVKVCLIVVLIVVLIKFHEI